MPLRKVLLTILVLFACGFGGFAYYREQQVTLHMELERDMAILQRDLAMMRCP